jgi:hypothetical protein
MAKYSCHNYSVNPTWCRKLNKNLNGPWQNIKASFNPYY